MGDYADKTCLTQRVFHAVVIDFTTNPFYLYYTLRVPMYFLEIKVLRVRWKCKQRGTILTPDPDKDFWPC